MVVGDQGPVEISQRPERIAALSGTHVEMLFAMGAGEQVIAGDLFSDFPAEAADLTLVDSFNLNVEAVIELDPDLVVLTFDPGAAVDGFAAVGIPTLMMGTPPNVEAVFDQIVTLGTATGHAEAADTLASEMAAALKAATERAGSATAGLTYYHETDPLSYYSPNGQSFLGQLYGLLGMVSIADQAPDEFGSGFPLLSPEFIVDADPSVIVLGGGGTTPEDIADRPGWDAMTAVQASRIVLIDADLASRWGPRIVDFVDQVVDAVLALEA